MRYAIRYNKHFKYMEELEEVIIEYGKDSNENIFKVLLDNSDLDDKRIVIKVLDLEFYEANRATELIRFLKLQKPELRLALAFPHSIEMEIREELKKIGIDYFYTVYAGDWEMFHGLAAEGVSDIYVTYGLGFDLEAAGALAIEKGISLRAFANVAQSSWPSSDDLKSFFVYPAAVPIYENYIDVLEFFGDLSPQQLETLYKIYAHDKHWFGNLKEIIIGLKTDLDERGLPISFATTRVHCRHKCLRGQPCHMCNRAQELTKAIVDKGWYFKHN